MTTVDENAIGVFERKILRIIFGPKKEVVEIKSRSVNNMLRNHEPLKIVAKRTLIEKY